MLLTKEDPSPFRVLREAGASDLFLTADHAGRAIPKALGDLGVSAAEMERHIAWDIGIAGVTERLSALLDATAVLQTYSRLVIDCNREPSWPTAMPAMSASISASTRPRPTHVCGQRLPAQSLRRIWMRRLVV